MERLSGRSTGRPRRPRALQSCWGRGSGVWVTLVVLAGGAGGGVCSAAPSLRARCAPRAAPRCAVAPNPGLAAAALRSSPQDLYVAVTKATLAEEVVPKEKHVRSERRAQALLAHVLAPA